MEISRVVKFFIFFLIGIKSFTKNIFFRNFNSISNTGYVFSFGSSSSQNIDPKDGVKLEKIFNFRQVIPEAESLRLYRCNFSYILKICKLITDSDLNFILSCGLRQRH